MNQLLNEFKDLSEEKREIESRLKQVKQRMKDLQEPLIELFTESGMQNVKLGNVTVYKRVDIVTGKRPEVDHDALNEALKKLGYEDLIQSKINPQTLGALIREMLDDKHDDPETELRMTLGERIAERIPHELSDCLNILELPQISTRRG